MPPFRIYPVIDLKGGIAVRAAGGDRARYAPLRSRLAEGPDPLAIARAYRAAFGLESIYVADLDAIEAGPPDEATLRALREDGFRLLVDGGCRSRDDAARLFSIGIEEVVAPLETLAGPGELERLIDGVGSERVVFSLDLKDGEIIGDRRAWGGGIAEVAREAYDRGSRRILVLDLARVGSRAGPAHVDVLRGLAADLAGVELLAGGGVRSLDDLTVLAGAGARGALLGTALHDGSIGGSIGGSIEAGAISPDIEPIRGRRQAPPGTVGGGSFR